MSIAVSAVVKPSRLLWLATVCMSAGCIALGIVVVVQSATGIAALGQARMVDMPGSAAAWCGLAAGAACIVAGAHAMREFLSHRAHFRIDISGTGQIRVERFNAFESRRIEHSARRKISVPSEPLRLLPQSTLWSTLMVLRLQCELGHIHTLFVLPDTVSQTSFRMLSVACHWIAAHNIRAGSENT